MFLAVMDGVFARVLRRQHVINFDMPKEIETYVHRIGRTGRCGKTGDIYIERERERERKHVRVAQLELLQRKLSLLPVRR